MGDGSSFLAAESVVPKIAAMFGDIAATLMLQLDNGYLVYFNPKRVQANTPRPVMRGYAPRPFGTHPSTPTPDEEQKYAQAEMDRRRATLEARERSKGRVRVYPALSQAMEEINAFYSSGGVVPGVDFKGLAEEKMAQSEGPEDLGLIS